MYICYVIIILLLHHLDYYYYYLREVYLLHDIFIVNPHAGGPYFWKHPRSNRLSRSDVHRSTVVEAIGDSWFRFRSYHSH